MAVNVGGLTARGGGLVTATALLAIGALILVAGAVVDAIGRPFGPEAVARRYFGALEASDPEGALELIAPDARARWTAFVENGLNNEYRVVSVAVRYPSILDRVRGATSDPTELTIFLDITQAVDGTRWQATPRVPAVRQDGRWYLAYPPLAEP